MGQLEIQDGFAPYSDHSKVIEVQNAATKRPARIQRAQAAESLRGPTPTTRRTERQDAKPGAGSQQMK